MKKIAFITLGCKVNKYESDIIASGLMGSFTVVSEHDKADYYVINTCAVTNEGEKKSRQAVAKALKLNADAKIIVCGCASQNNREQFENKPNVVAVFGSKDKTDIINYIANLELMENYTGNLFPIKNSTRAYLKIQDGCNRFCSYCIIPYVRGRSESRDLQDIVCEAELLAKEHPEIVLVGIDISDYKIDGQPALSRVVTALKDLPVRVRISSLENNIITPEFLTELKKAKNFAPHFHLSLQSGDDEVLKKMNRRYDTKTYLEKCNLIRKYFKDANITTDIIVGFPFESDEQFENTCRFVKRVGFGKIHIFPYSKRKGTVAEKWEDNTGVVKKKRVEKLSNIEKELSKNFISDNIGLVKHVLVEEKQGGLFVGFTENYLKVYLSADDIACSKFYKVRLVEAFKDGVKGELI